MDKLTINIDVPTEMPIDLNRLKKVTDDFVQKYISQLYIYGIKNEVTAKRSDSFRKLRGIMSSDKPYKEMLEDALKEKYSL